MAVSRFSFGGGSIIAPGVLVRSIIGANQVYALLPFGTECFVGESDGGHGSGTVYIFNDPSTATGVLRGGGLLDSINLATGIGGCTGVVAVVIGTKTAASRAISGTGAATLVAGDQGLWTDQITYKVQSGTSSGFAFTVFWPDAFTTQTNSVGGLGTGFDNLADYNALAAAITANIVLTPPTTSGLIPIVSLTVGTNGIPSNTSGTVPLAGGTGDGSYGGATYAAPSFSDVKKGIDALVDVPFDLGTLVQVYDLPSQAYANSSAETLAPYAYLRRWIHQVVVSGANATNTKQVNSAAVVAAGVAAASAMDSIRASVFAQKSNILNPTTGQFEFSDSAPLFMGLAALQGSVGKWGPATPLTFENMPGVSSVDFAILQTTGDLDNAVAGGLIALQQNGAAVRVVQSITTAVYNAEGAPWDFSEFSIVRVSDALLANMKAMVETQSPKGLGAGNTLDTLQGLLAGCRTVLEDALTAKWITAYDNGSIQIATADANGSDYILSYSAAPTRPINHIGIAQTLLPFQAILTLGSTS